MSKGQSGFNLAKGVKRFLPVFGMSLLAILGAEAARQAGTSHVLVDAALIFCGFVVARVLQRIG